MTEAEIRAEMGAQADYLIAAYRYGGSVAIARETLVLAAIQINRQTNMRCAMLESLLAAKDAELQHRSEEE